MKHNHIKTDIFQTSKQKRLIYRVSEPDTAILFWLSGKKAVRYVQRRHIQKLLNDKKHSWRQS